MLAHAQTVCTRLCFPPTHKLKEHVCACSKSRRNSGAIGNYRSRLHYVTRIITSSQREASRASWMLYNVCWPSFWLPNFTLTTVEARQWEWQVYNLNDVFVEHVFVRQRCFLASNRWFAKQLPSCWRLSRDVAVTATSPSGKMVNCYELELAILIFSAMPSAVPPVRDRIIINASHPFKLVNLLSLWILNRNVGTCADSVYQALFSAHTQIKRAWFEAK